MTNRREFMKVTSATMLAATALNTTAFAGKGANDKLVVGLIGCGGRGLHDAGLFRKMKNVEVAYVCDVDEARRGAAAKALEIKSERSVSDLRRVLDDNSVDAVLVTTPDHWAFHRSHRRV